MNEHLLKCLRCDDDKRSSEVLVLQCNHVFCLICLDYYVSGNLKLNIECPIYSCHETLTDFQIRTILPEQEILNYESLVLSCLDETHSCLLSECCMKIEFESKNIQYDCPNCSLYNCISCRAAHKFMNCENFRKLPIQKAERLCQREINRARTKFLNRIASTNQNSERTNLDLLHNDKIFECFFCMIIIGKGCGIQLRNCRHLVCRECLYNHVKSSIEFPINCPNRYCDVSIEEREIHKLLSENDYEVYRRKMLNRIKPKLVNLFQCQTPDCDFFCELKTLKVKTLLCPKCKLTNCIRCNAVHNKETCGKYQTRIKSTDFAHNMEFVEIQTQNGIFMKCPCCQNLIRKVKGCDCVRCPKCEVELCWILKKRRWGEKGRGDTSGGCRCMVDNIPCHPDCNGCIPH